MRRPRMRIGTLMLLVMIVATTLAGYRYYSRHIRKITVIYPVARHVVRPKEGAIDFQSLLSALRRDVMPGTWEGQGGHGTARPIYLNLSLRVDQSEAAHERVAEFLGRSDPAADDAVESRHNR